MPYHAIRLGTALPGASRRVELCHDRAKTTVWLQLTNTEFIIGGASPVFVTALIGAIRTPTGWQPIDAGTAARLRDVTIAFGTKLGDRIDEFQRAITRDWSTFDGARASHWAKGLTVGHDMSNPSFVMKAIKTGFDAIGVSVSAYSGLRMKGFSVDDAIDYLQRRAAVAGVNVVDGALLDFEEIGPDPTLRVQEDKAYQSDPRMIPYVPAKRNGHGGHFSYPELTASVPFPRVLAYGFRGDSRLPSAIKNAGGFNPNYTRPDQIAKAAAQGNAQDRALNLPEFLANQFYGGYISVCKSYAVTKAFATGMGGTTPPGPGWVYACFVEGGFVIPPAGTIPATATHPQIKIPYNEQEISMPGLLDWDDVVGCRRVSSNGRFEGNIFLRQTMAQQDPQAAVALWKLLSGETQGPGLPP
ncbi:hypothetical protein EJV46_00530 [Roseococcus sp. SYP-B2431]|uniref:hypothetical protein n=1 Tax=Roseococcus sp. SYP-B2431 TaxID=2496640 RepID=UPI00103C4444|nr:hypothetical protein [Roseococcus sp. SYP-B2431]TCI00976.1 hypothetical protein EJV46_00530 [Roseococcus sp. SYP-B2431]